MSIPDLRAKLSLDLTEWNASVEAAKKSAKSLEGKLENLKKVGQSFAAVGAVMTASLGLVVKSFINTTSYIDDTSKALQLSTKAFQELNYVASQTGTDFGGVSMGIRTLSRVVTEAAEGNEEYKKTLTTLGLSFQELLRLSPEKQLARIGEALSKLPSPTQRTALSLELFGRSGTAILEATKNINKLSKEAEHLGIIIDTQVIEAGDKLGDSFSTIKSQLIALVANIGSALAPALLELTAMMKKATAGIIEFVKENPKLVAFVTTTTAILGGLTLAFGGLLTAITMTIPALVIMGASLSAAVLPITAIVAGVTAVVGIFVYWKEIVYGVRVAFDAVLKAILQGLNVFVSVARTSLGWLPVIGEQVKANALAAAKSLSQAIDKIDEESLARKQERERKKIDILVNGFAERKRLENKKNADLEESASKLTEEGGRKRAETIIKREMDTLKITAENARKAIDARLAYEKSQFDKFSVEQKKATLENEKAIIDERLKITREGTQEYYMLMQQRVENDRALNDLANTNMVTGFSNAIDAMQNKTMNYKERTTQMFDEMQSGISSAFESLLTNMSNGFADFGDFITKIGDAIKGAMIRMVADIAAEWIMKHLLMQAATLAWKALEISAAAAVAAAKAAAASAWSLWGAIAIGAAIGAAVLKMAGAFATGGLVEGNSFTGDNLLIRVNSGERVLNAEQQDWLEKVGAGVRPSGETQNAVSIQQSIHIENGGDMESIIDALQRGTLEALEMANLTVKIGNKQSGLAV